MGENNENPLVEAVVKLYNKVNLEKGKIATIDDIEEGYNLTKQVIYKYVDAVKDNRAGNESVKAKATMEDLISSFKQDSKRSNNPWSTAASIILKDLNSFVTKSLRDDNLQINFESYLYLGKEFIKVDNENLPCFKFEYPFNYDVSNIAEQYNLMLKKIGIKRYINLLLILVLLDYNEAPTIFLQNVKNKS